MPVLVELTGKIRALRNMKDVRACEKLEELRIGNWSFMDYATCEIEEAAMLEVVEVGDVNAEEDCCCFYYADLELKGGGGGEG